MRKSLILPLAFAGALSLTGCTGLNPTQQSTLTGAAGGAAAGALLGAIAGDAGLGALIGGGVGAAGGFLAQQSR